MSLTDPDFHFIKDLIYEEAALYIEDDKKYLVQARMIPLIQENALVGIHELVERVRAGDRALRKDVVEAMTTNETSFFRDRHPFDTLRKEILPELIERRRATKRLSIWSAACSSGQEPYSIAMIIREHFPELLDWKVTILATDLSEQILDEAREGLYNQIAVNRGLPVSLLMKYFRREGTRWRIRDDLRDMITFRPHNLARPWPLTPPMDIVYLRNVLIYFDQETKQAILERTRRVLRSDGYLFLGGCETTLFSDRNWETLRFGRTIAYQERQRATPSLSTPPPPTL